jgi:hypothetical protein
MTNHCGCTGFTTKPLDCMFITEEIRAKKFDRDFVTYV